jgi:hypothetical protein
MFRVPDPAHQAKLIQAYNKLAADQQKVFFYPWFFALSPFLFPLSFSHLLSSTPNYPPCPSL